MNRRQMMQTLALTVLGSGTCLSGATDALSPDRPDASPQPELFRVGDTLRYDGGLKITLLAVKKDSRCPQDAKCATPGDATVLLRIKVGKSPASKFRLHTDRGARKLVIPVIPPVTFAAGAKGTPKKFTISIRSLTPLPYTLKGTPQSEYRLDLKVVTTY